MPKSKQKVEYAFVGYKPKNYKCSICPDRDECSRHIGWDCNQKAGQGKVGTVGQALLKALEERK